MGMGDTRVRDNRAADQDQTQSGNPNTIYNAPQFRGRTPSFHQQPAERPFIAPVRGAPGRVAQMPPQAAPAPQPVRQFNAPRFSTNTFLRGRQMNQ